MSGGAIFQLVLQGLVFIVWAILMFRMLFTLRQRAEMETGSTFPGPMQFLKQMGIWFRAPEDRQERNALLFLTFVLLMMSLSSAFLGGAV